MDRVAIDDNHRPRKDSNERIIPVATSPIPRGCSRSQTAEMNWHRKDAQFGLGDRSTSGIRRLRCPDTPTAATHEAHFRPPRKLRLTPDNFTKQGKGTHVCKRRYENLKLRALKNRPPPRKRSFAAKLRSRPPPL